MDQKEFDPTKSNASTDQTQQRTTSKLETPTTPPSKGVFIMRAEGQSWEEFKEAVIQKFRDAGMIAG